MLYSDQLTAMICVKKKTIWVLTPLHLETRFRLSKSLTHVISSPTTIPPPLLSFGDWDSVLGLILLLKLVTEKRNQLPPSQFASEASLARKFFPVQLCLFFIAQCALCTVWVISPNFKCSKRNVWGFQKEAPFIQFYLHCTMCSLYSLGYFPQF